MPQQSHEELLRQKVAGLLRDDVVGKRLSQTNTPEGFGEGVPNGVRHGIHLVDALSSSPRIVWIDDDKDASKGGIASGNSRLFPPGETKARWHEVQNLLREGDKITCNGWVAGTTFTISWHQTGHIKSHYRGAPREQCTVARAPSQQGPTLPPPSYTEIDAASTTTTNASIHPKRPLPHDFETPMPRRAGGSFQDRVSQSTAPFPGEGTAISVSSQAPPRLRSSRHPDFLYGVPMEKSLTAPGASGRQPLYVGRPFGIQESAAPLSSQNGRGALSPVYPDSYGFVKRGGSAASDHSEPNWIPPDSTLITREATPDGPYGANMVIEEFDSSLRYRPQSEANLESPDAFLRRTSSQPGRAVSIDTRVTVDLPSAADQGNAYPSSDSQDSRRGVAGSIGQEPRQNPRRAGYPHMVDTQSHSHRGTSMARSASDQVSPRHSIAPRGSVRMSSFGSRDATLSHPGSLQYRLQFSNASRESHLNAAPVTRYPPEWTMERGRQDSITSLTNNTPGSNSHRSGLTSSMPQGDSPYRDHEQQTRNSLSQS